MIFVADYYRWHHVIVISRTLYLFVLGWLSLRLRGQTWRSVGWPCIGLGDGRLGLECCLASEMNCWSYM